jgi:hypothetical protein
MDVSGQPHTLATLPLGKNPWYPLNRRMGGPNDSLGVFGEEKNLLALPEIESWIIQPVVQLLYQPFYPGPVTSEDINTPISLRPILIVSSHFPLKFSDQVFKMHKSKECLLVQNP